MLKAIRMKKDRIEAAEVLVKCITVHLLTLFKELFWVNTV